MTVTLHRTPCAACKLLRRKCTGECMFASCFPPHQTKAFEMVHKVFGASNVAKILIQTRQENHQSAAESLVYCANEWLQDPMHGTIRKLLPLQQELIQLDFHVGSIETELTNFHESVFRDFDVYKQQHPEILEAQETWKICRQSRLKGPNQMTALQPQYKFMGSNAGFKVKQGFDRSVPSGPQMGSSMPLQPMRSYDQQREFVRMNSGLERNSGFNRSGPRSNYSNIASNQLFDGQLEAPVHRLRSPPVKGKEQMWSHDQQQQHGLMTMNAGFGGNSESNPTVAVKSGPQPGSLISGNQVFDELLEIQDHLLREGPSVKGPMTMNPGLGGDHEFNRSVALHSEQEPSSKINQLFDGQFEDQDHQMMAPPLNGKEPMLSYHQQQHLRLMATNQDFGGNHEFNHSMVEQYGLRTGSLNAGHQLLDDEAQDHQLMGPSLKGKDVWTYEQQQEQEQQQQLMRLNLGIGGPSTEWLLDSMLSLDHNQQQFENPYLMQQQQLTLEAEMDALLADDPYLIWLYEQQQEQLDQGNLDYSQMAGPSTGPPQNPMLSLDQQAPHNQSPRLAALIKDQNALRWSFEQLHQEFMGMNEFEDDLQFADQPFDQQQQHQQELMMGSGLQDNLQFVGEPLDPTLASDLMHQDVENRLPMGQYSPGTQAKLMALYKEEQELLWCLEPTD